MIPNLFLHETNKSASNRTTVTLNCYYEMWMATTPTTKRNFDSLCISGRNSISYLLLWKYANNFNGFILFEIVFILFYFYFSVFQNASFLSRFKLHSPLGFVYLYSYFHLHDDSFAIMIILPRWNVYLSFCLWFFLFFLVHTINNVKLLPICGVTVQLKLKLKEKWMLVQWQLN